MVNGVTVELNRVRKNGKNTAFVVVTESEGAVYYETLREAVYHAMSKKDGDIILMGSNKLMAFWCNYSKSMRFGFGANEHDKNQMKSDLWWANWNQSKLA